MSKKKEDKKLTKDQTDKKILTLKKDLFNIRFKKVNNQINNPAQYNVDHLTPFNRTRPELDKPKADNGANNRVSG